MQHVANCFGVDGSRAARAKRASPGRCASRSGGSCVHVPAGLEKGRNLVQASSALGQIERDLGRGDAARPLYEEAVAICREEGDPLLLAHTIRHLGDIHRNIGRCLTEAEPCYQEALPLYRSQPTNPPDLANGPATGPPQRSHRKARRGEATLGRSEGTVCGGRCASWCRRMLGTAGQARPIVRRWREAGSMGAPGAMGAMPTLAWAC